jgi:aminocarboxymuconate-semialdehyde decarboxylase
MTGNSSGRARERTIDFHAHVVVPEVYDVAAEHNIFAELPADPGVTDEMRVKIKARGAVVLGRMSDIGERLAKMDAMGVDAQVLSASLVHQGLEWAGAQLSLRLARTTNDWIARAVATICACSISIPASTSVRCCSISWTRSGRSGSCSAPIILWVKVSRSNS